MHTLILALCLAAPTWWYGVDASGVVTGWVCSPDEPSPSAIGAAVEVHSGPDPSDLSKDLGPARSADGVRRWGWDGEAPAPRGEKDLEKDQGEVKRQKWREALLEYKAAAAVDAEEPAAFTPQELAEIKDRADQLKAEVEAP